MSKRRQSEATVRCRRLCHVIPSPDRVRAPPVRSPRQDRPVAPAVADTDRSSGARASGLSYNGHGPHRHAQPRLRAAGGGAFGGRPRRRRRRRLTPLGAALVRHYAANRRQPVNRPRRRSLRRSARSCPRGGRLFSSTPSPVRSAFTDVGPAVIAREAIGTRAGGFRMAWRIVPCVRTARGVMECAAAAPRGEAPVIAAPRILSLPWRKSRRASPRDQARVKLAFGSSGTSQARSSRARRFRFPLGR